MIYLDVQMPTNCYDCWIRQNMGCSIANGSGWLNDRRDDKCPLKAQEVATVEPKRIELADETKAWLDKMDAVDALSNIADICIDWDGYRTANGLGGLINEIWAYARYCADMLLKAQEPVEARLNLCESCAKEFAECGANKSDLVFGSGVGNDNIIGCPWYTNRWKSQEPRVMTLEEVVARRGEPAYMEAKSAKGYKGWVLVYDVQEGMGITGTRVGVTKPGHITIWPATELYGVKWRCWTSRPDEKTREATPWN